MGKFFLENLLTHLCIFKMISVSWGSFEVCMLGYPPTPPPPPWGARRPTARPADPQGLGQPRGGSPPPYSPQNCRTPLGVTHWLAAAPVSYGVRPFQYFPAAPAPPQSETLRIADQRREVLCSGGEAPTSRIMTRTGHQRPCVSGPHALTVRSAMTATA